MMPPMRIMIGLHSLELGGSQINTVDLAAELRRRGHHVVLWVIDDDRHHRATIEPVAVAAAFEIRHLPFEARLVAQARHVTRLADESRADVVHVFHEHHRLGPVAAIAARSRPGRAVVVTNWMMEHTHFLPPHAPLIVGFGALQQEAAALQKGPVWLLEPPVDIERDRPDVDEATDFRRALGIETTEVIAALVTRVDRMMKFDGIALTIRAVEQMNEPALRLVIVGDGDAMEAVTELAHEANERMGREAVVMTGSLVDPRPAYAAADVVLGMGGSALRGMAFGKPVVVLGGQSFSLTFSQATEEYFFEHGFYGSADDDPSGEQLVGRLQELLDPDLRNRMGTYGTEVIRNRFSLDVQTTKLEQIYTDALENSPNWRERWGDAAYVTAYDAIGRALPPQRRQAVRSLVPRLRSGKQSWS